jgi:hypothetical protein
MNKSVLFVDMVEGEVMVAEGLKKTCRPTVRCFKYLPSFRIIVLNPS